MMQQVFTRARSFSTSHYRLVKQKVPNPNVTPHNPEHRAGMTDFSFMSSFNMGYEGFSKPLPLNRMNPIYGNKNEYLFLVGLFALVPLVKSARKKNEDALREQVKATNSWAEMPLSH